MMLPVLLFEMKSYLSNRMALFWMAVYPVAMLALLIVLFDPGLVHGDVFASYRFQTIVGLVALTIVSTALFGMGQALGERKVGRAMVPYLFLPTTIFSVVLAILFSRIIAVLLFSVAFLLGSFAVLGIEAGYSPVIALQVLATLSAYSLFSFAVVLPLVLVSSNATTIIALANVVNIYAIMSSGVFIPIAFLTGWSKLFITTSPFYYFNLGLQSSFQNGFGLIEWSVNLSAALFALALLYFTSTRRFLVPK